MPGSRGGAAQVLRHRTWTPDDANQTDERSGEREARPARRSSSSFTAPFRESFFDLAQRYHRLREAAFHMSKPVSERKPRVDTTPPPIPLMRERRLADLPPARDEQESVTEAFADRFVDEAPEEATLVQPLARRASEAPPPVAPVSERVGYSTMRPPPPPDPLPRIMPAALMPSTMPPPPVALATVPPPPPPAPPASIWRPMLATAALSATIGAIVSVGMWAVRSPADASRPTAATIGPVKAEPTTVSTIGPCPVPSTPSNSTTSTASNSSLSSTSSQSSIPHEVSLDALPLEGKSPRALAAAAPVLRAPAPVAPPPRAARAVVATRAAVAEPARPTRAERAESERAARHHKSTEAAAPAAAAENDDDEAPAAAPPPSPPPAPTAGPDRAAIAKAVAKASAAASSCDASPQSGRAQITFAPSGNVQSVQLIQPFSDNSVNGCVLRALGRAHVPPFAGEPVIVRKALNW
jgi:hypothetical protein